MPSTRPVLSRDTWVSVAAFVLALALCLYYQAHAVIDGPLRADAAQYTKLAINLLQHHVLSSAEPGSVPLSPESYRTPGYPLILAVIYQLSGQDLQRFYSTARLLQAVMAALTVVFVFRLGRRFLGFWFATAAAMLLAFWPMSIVQSGYLLTETAFGFFLTGGIWLACIAPTRSSRALVALSAAMLVFSAAINPMLAPFLLILAGALWLGKHRMSALILIAFVGVPWMAWTIRNAHLPAVTTATSQGHRLAENILIGMSPDIKRYYNDRASPEGARVFADLHRMLDLHDKDPSAFKAAVWRRLTDQPGKYLHWYLVEKPGDVWFWPVIQGAGGIYVYPNVQSPFETNVLYRLTAMLGITLSSIWLIGALAGATYGLVGWLLGRQRLWPLLVLSLLFWYFSLLYWVLTPDGRYVTPFRGCEFLLAMYALSWLSAMYRARRKRMPGLSSPDRGTRVAESALATTERPWTT